MHFFVMESMQIKGKCPGASERGTERLWAQSVDAAVFEQSHYCFITEKTPAEEKFSCFCTLFFGFIESQWLSIFLFGALYKCYKFSGNSLLYYNRHACPFFF